MPERPPMWLEGVEKDLEIELNDGASDPIDHAYLMKPS